MYNFLLYHPKSRDVLFIINKHRTQSAYEPKKFKDFQRQFHFKEF